MGANPFMGPSFGRPLPCPGGPNTFIMLRPPRMPPRFIRPPRPRPLNPRPLWRQKQICETPARFEWTILISIQIKEDFGSNVYM